MMFENFLKNIHCFFYRNLFFPEKTNTNVEMEYVTWGHTMKQFRLVGVIQLLIFSKNRR